MTPSHHFSPRGRLILLAGLGALLLAGFLLAGMLRPSFDPLKLGSSEFDIPYCSPGGIELKMDLYYPAYGGPWPALVYVHGGGWTEGDKSGVLVTPSEAGYLVASINYRLYPAFQFPAMIEDVKCAVRFLRQHARQYNLDPERIALIGHSAGGHLVALAGLADESAGWDVGQYRNQSSRVQAVVVLAGPADLTRGFPGWVDQLLRGVFGAEQLVSGSPVTYASPDDPPFLVIHGEADPVVPLEQATLLAQALTNAGVPVELLTVRNGGHGFEPVGAETIPSGPEIYQRMLEFLERVLRSGSR